MQNSADIRMLSTAMLHQLRIDGIEREPNSRETHLVTPYGVHGIMSAKFQLLLTLISNDSNAVHFQRILSKAEMCHLHRMISSTVQPWERGDEHSVCPMRGSQSGNHPHRHSHASSQRQRHHWVRPFE